MWTIETLNHHFSNFRNSVFFFSEMGQIQTLTFHGASGDASVTATFSISPRGSSKIDISADIYAENGRIFSIEACSGRGECHIYIEDNQEPTTENSEGEEDGEGDIMIPEHSRTPGGNKTVLYLEETSLKSLAEYYQVG